MTSRTKIYAITKAAKRLSCSVLLKVGDPPGIMLAEGQGALEWMEVVRVRPALLGMLDDHANAKVQKLRYKDYQLLKKEAVEECRLGVPAGTVRELTSVKEFGAFLSRDDEIYRWWRVNMGYVRDNEK
jgi:hypothetical protein